MSALDHLGERRWAQSLDVRAAHAQPVASKGKKRRFAEGDAGTNKKAKHQKRLDKKTSYHASMYPEMAETDSGSAAVFPDQKNRPKRDAPCPATIEEHALLSAADREELAALLQIGDSCLFQHHPADGILSRAPRYSLEHAQLVEPFPQKPPSKTKTMGLDPERSPISTIDGIFDDIASNATKFGLKEALPPFALRIATMCSGTEAPLLGMTLMQQALKRQDEISFDVSHIFSAEIEPYKQAYIERNFRPPLLFRDVTEFVQDGEVHTAYGGTAPQPHDVHILVAGSSCIDYSSLNQSRKQWADEGQSFRTLEGIQSYAKRAQPNIIILENVRNAPWPKIKTFLLQAGYACEHVLVDTKDYYLPQTRQRGYLIAFHERYLEGHFNKKVALKAWIKLMRDFERRANAPFSDFIYDDDDPELYEAKFDSESVDTAAKTMGWAACRHRYAKLRVEKLYGSLRPMTRWQNNGSCKFPDFGWIKWSKIQRERIWDTLDIEYLRHGGERGYDMNYKIRWLELSQNVDRDFDARQWGIISCLTPSGIPYVTTRGGPVSGGESLLLQGIPKHALNLTKETSRELQNLAGNAMSVPVVTVAILGGILAAHEGMKGSGLRFFEDFSEHDKLKNSTDSLIEIAPPIATPLDELLRDVKAKNGTSIQIDSVVTLNAENILHEASITLQFCKCEGISSTKRGPFQICEDCGHMTCKTCGRNPVHKYRDIAGSVTGSRGSPADFMTMITKALPTILEISVADGNELASSLGPVPKYHTCEEQFRMAAKLAFQSTVTFKNVKRGHSWKITFEGERSRLELRISRKCSLSAATKGDFFGREAVECHWLLFANAPSRVEAGSDLRAALKYPVARMIPQNTLLSGVWEIMRYTRVNLDIEPANDERVPSWESSIGLQDHKFRGLTRAAALHVSVWPMENEEAKDIGRSVAGTYVLRSKCGAACASLHVRRETASQTDSLMFFFLEPEQLKDAKFDSFVFSTTNYRRGYMEYRMVQAEVDEGWLPPEFSTKIRSTKASAMTTFQTWVSCDALSVNVPLTMAKQHFWMMPTFKVTMSSHTACSHAYTFMLIELPIETYHGSNWRSGYQFPIQLMGKKSALEHFRWLLERAAGHMLAQMNTPHQISVGDLSSLSCSTCAPKPPSIEYAQVKVAAQKNNQAHEKDSVKPMENRVEATRYERALKHRPSPVTATVHCHDRSAILEVKLNIPALCHQVLAKLCSPQDLLLQQPSIEWSLAGDHGRERAPKFKIKAFLNNENEATCAKPKHFKRDLWPEQGKALTWMVRREIEPCKWLEHEREEVSIPPLGCRVDVEARILKKVRGGVLADEVGGGKTTTSLALVAKMLELGNTEHMPKDSRSISVDATLILVPQSLIKQWEGETNDCLGPDDADRRLVVRTVDQLLALKILDLREKDIILAPWNLFDKPTYWAALERLCGARNKPPKPGRAFQQWLHKALEDLAKLNQASQGDDTHNVWTRSGGSDTVEEDGIEQEEDRYAFSEALNKHHPGKSTGFAPLFHACTFRRIIIDEYSYLEGHSFLASLELKSLSMWLLSGTPPTSNFDAINTTAKLLKTKVTSEDENDGCFSFVTKGARLNTEKTDAEHFQWYKDERSPAWLRARNRLAETFVDNFVRKNSAEAARSIEKISHYEVSLLSAHEQIVYFEVFHRLMSQNIKFKTAPNKSTMVMSHSERLDMTVYASDHPEDALLSCCSEVSKIYQITNATTTLEEMCTPVINDTRRAIEDLYRQLYANLREALAYEKIRKRDEEDVLKNPHLLSFKLRIKNNDVGDKLAAELIDRVMQVAYDRQKMPVAPYEPRCTQNSARIRSTEDDLAAEPEEDDKVSKDEEADAELEGPEPDRVSETTPVAERTATGAKHFAYFQASTQRRPSYMNDIVPNGNRTDCHEPRRAEQRKFRSSDLKVRTNEQKSRSEDLNMVTIDLVNQIRVLRLFGNFQRVLRGQELPPCSGCGTTSRKLSDLYIMGTCGHIACRPCLQDEEVRQHDPDGCLDKLCNAPGLRHHLIEASRFSAGQTSSTTVNGSKMDAVVSKVREILESTADSILVFVQFARVLKALTQALTAGGLRYEDAASGEKTESKVESFRNGNGHRVLLLLIDSANAAGWNLQRANHVMFVSAYFAPTRSEYVATMTQAIGRAHRMGQKKSVHVYHFLMAKTIEVNILQDREKKALVKQRDGTFLLEDRHGSGPTAWEGPDMQGAASGAGDVDMAEADIEHVVDESDARTEAGEKDTPMSIGHGLEAYPHDPSVCVVCTRAK